MADRPANTTGKSVSSPGKGSKRTDLSPSKGPIRIAGGKGVPYGSGKQQHQMQAARQDAPSPAPTSPASAPVSPPAGSTGLDPRSMLGMIGRAPTAFPGDPIGAPQQTQRPSQISAEEASIALEQMIANAGGAVSAGTLRLLNDLRREALRSPTLSLDGADLAALDELA